MLKVHDARLLGSVGILRHQVNAWGWSRLNNGYPTPGYRRRYRGSLRVLPNIYGPGGTMGSY